MTAAALRLKSYLLLTKPRIMLLVVLSGAAALVWEGTLLEQPGRLLLVLAALFLTGGSANGINHYLERDRDAMMRRTRGTRPLPMGWIRPAEALIFSIAIGMGGVVVLGLWFNWLAAGLALFTILFYSLLYTLVLKPSTPHNTLLGGIAGAMVPVGAWAAASGRIALEPWSLFALIFFWSAPHFWLLAVGRREEYIRSGLPMLPVVRSARVTLLYITLFQLLMFAASLTPLLLGCGTIYLVLALLGSVALLLQLRRLWRDPSRPVYRAMFHFSIIYLCALLAAVIADRLIAA